MADAFHVEPDELRGYSSMLERVAGQFSSIEQHAQTKGGDTSGFTGLLALLIPVVDGVVDLYGQTLKYANQKMTDVRTELDKAVGEYEARDHDGASRINAAGGRR
jgi:excreted virulence factor EspC (type VII ESX diderm)